MIPPSESKNTKRTAAILGVTLAVLGVVLAVKWLDWNPGPDRHFPVVNKEQRGGPRTPGRHLAGKIRREGDRQYLWAKGPKDPQAESSEWFDLTGSPLPLEGFQFGIGKDTIPSIDNPVFVKPDDERLRAKWGNVDIDKIAVIGFTHNGVSRAYPISLLNRHELVNDTIGGKPVTIGW